MSNKEEITNRRIKSESEGAILIWTQKNIAIGFILLISFLSIIVFYLNLESEAAPYLFILFCTWILSHGIYSVLLINNNTNKKLQDIELYAEDLRAYPVENIEKLTEPCSKLDLNLKFGVSRKPPTENINQSKKSESAATKETNSILKILLGVAITSYSYDPKALKNSATTDIVNDLALAGISIDPGTVLRHLKAAAQDIEYVIPKNRRDIQN